MRRMTFVEATDDALSQAMSEDPKIIIFGEDAPGIRRTLFVLFGKERVLGTPISESAFLGAAVAAAMGGLRPVVDLGPVDFLGVCIDALLNQASKVEAFSGGNWRVPLVVRCACGGGYGDGGQHEQSLWGWLAHIPGLTVVVPSNPADAGGLMLAALGHESPVIFLEHKLLAENWLEFLGSGGRKTVHYDIPAAGARGMVPNRWQPLPFGQAAIVKEGYDLTMVSLGVGVHRCLEATAELAKQGIQAGVIDLRTVAPLDKQTVRAAVAQTGRMLVVDEDYEGFGLSGELAAIVLEAGINFNYRRVCTQSTIPYARQDEDKVLPNVQRILIACRELLESQF
ncbi:MAG TPA: transketolase C-terminal domain-containing protein [Anaerolineales bacterium]|nr:transketolase C-terminal domain-containing protein [Anaerolineales bacterium]